MKDFVNKHKTTLIISTLVLLLPTIVGLFLWNFLPETMPIHWNVAGEADSWGSRAQVVFLLPGLLLGLHWVSIFATAKDPRRAAQSHKIHTLVLWLCPALSLVLCAITYTSALGYEPVLPIIVPLFMGVLLLVIGNYLPKCQQNHTIGIRIPWALKDEANWNATHRFGGWCYVLASIPTLCLALIHQPWSIGVGIGILLLATLAPILFSFLYYCKQKKGTAD